MTADRAVMIGCAALLAALVFADQREGAQGELLHVGPRTRAEMDDKARQREAVQPASPPTHTDLLVALMNDRCIEWHDPLSERDMMTCGDTVPAVQVVSLERRFIP